MNSQSISEFKKKAIQYTPMPVNLLAGFDNGEIMSALYAPILIDATGN